MKNIIIPEPFKTKEIPLKSYRAKTIKPIRNGQPHQKFDEAIYYLVNYQELCKRDRGCTLKNQSISIYKSQKRIHFD